MAKGVYTSRVAQNVDSFVKGKEKKDEVNINQRKKQEEQTSVPPAPIENKNKVGRPAADEKKTQVSLYLTESLVKGLRVQSAEQEKESDRSALARTGIEIVLDLSGDVYKKLKAAAEQQGKTTGQIVNAALIQYLCD